MPKIPTSGIGPKISSSVPVASVPVGTLNAEAQAFAGFTGVVNDVMSKAGQIMTEVEATDYFNSSLKTYEKEYDETLQTYQKQLDDTGRLTSGQTLEEAMTEWSSTKIQDFTDNAPTDRAYSTVKDGFAPYDRRTVANARSVQFEHVTQRQMEKIKVLDPEELDRAIQDYIPGDSTDFITYTKNRLAHYHAGLDSKSGLVINPTQVDQFKHMYGHQASNSVLRSMDRLEMYDGMANIFGQEVLRSPQVEKMIAEEMGLTVSELTKIVRGRPLKNDGAINLKEADVIGLYNNVTKAATIAKPDELEKYLTGEEKDHYLRAMIRGFKEQKKVRDGLLAERITQLKETWGEGKGSVSTDAEARQVLAQIAVTDTMEDWQKTKTMGELIAHRYMDRAIKRLPLASPTEAIAQIKAIPSQTQEYMVLAEELMEGAGVPIKNHYASISTAARGTLNDVQGKLLQRKYQLDTELAKNPAQYLIDYSPKGMNIWQRFEKARASGDYVAASTFFKEFTGFADREQNRLGVPVLNKKFLPLQMSKQIKAGLNDALKISKDPKTVDELLTTYERAFGDLSFQIFSEIERNGDIPPAVNYARSLPLDKRAVVLRDAAAIEDIQELSKGSKVTLSDAQTALLEHESIQTLRSAMLASRFPNNMSYLNSVETALRNRIFVEAVSKGEARISDKLVNEIVNEYYDSMVYSRRGTGYTASIPKYFLQNLKPGTTDLEVDTVLNVAKDVLITDQYVYEVPLNVFEQIKSSLIVAYPQEDFSKFTHATSVEDSRVQERFRKMLYQKGEIMGTNPSGMFLQLDGQTVGRRHKGTVQDVVLPWKEGLNDKRVTDKMLQKLGPSAFQKLFQMKGQ